MSSALSHSSSRSIATRVMYGVALVALLAFGVAAAASYLRSSQALLTGARALVVGVVVAERRWMSSDCSAMTPPTPFRPSPGTT